MVAALGLALTLAAYGAAAASTATLTANALHITDHSAYVEAVVDFTGPGLTLSQARATDPNPSDGTAGVLVSYPNVASHLLPVTMHGLGVWVVEVPYGLSVGIGALPGAFKYLSYSPLAPSQSPSGVWTGHELIVLVSGLDPDGKPYPSGFARIAAYSPASKAWRRLAPLPAARLNADVAWDGHEMLVIGGIGALQGGRSGSPAKVGFAYDPKAGRWRPVAPMPAGRTNFPAEWTGKRLLIWGGSTPPSGLAFDPNANRWSSLPSAPLTGRASLTAVWTGRSMILWGGAILNQQSKVFTEGASFTPTVRWNPPGDGDRAARRPKRRPVTRRK